MFPVRVTSSATQASLKGVPCLQSAGRGGFGRDRLPVVGLLRSAQIAKSPVAKADRASCEISRR